MSFADTFLKAFAPRIQSRMPWIGLISCLLRDDIHWGARVATEVACAQPLADKDERIAAMSCTSVLARRILLTGSPPRRGKSRFPRAWRNNANLSKTSRSSCECASISPTKSHESLCNHFQEGPTLRATLHQRSSMDSGVDCFRGRGGAACSSSDVQYVARFQDMVID